jgi:predicted enzyme related to lactoylglutathione lyase
MHKQEANDELQQHPDRVRGSWAPDRLLHQAVRRAGLGRWRLHRLADRQRRDTIGPHDQVHGKNAEPGRIIWNIESADVKADFDRLKAAGAMVIREPYSFEGAPDAWIATLADADDNYFQLVSPMEGPSS